MADERDPRVSNRYRELGAEEPPRALDEAILAASRRPVRSFAQRWSVPISLAAVVVLSVVVTLRIQHEQPGIEAPEPRPAPAGAQPAKAVKEKAEAAPAPAEAEAKPQSIKTERTDQPAARKEPQAFPRAARERDEAAGTPAKAAAAPAATAAPAAAPAPAPAAEAPARAASRAPASADTLELRRDAAPRTDSRAAGAVAPQDAPQRALSKLGAETPERELERIAQLRRDGRHGDADKALAEFRKRHPDYKIPPEVLERVERR